MLLVGMDSQHVGKPVYVTYLENADFSKFHTFKTSHIEEKSFMQIKLSMAALFATVNIWK